MWRVLVSVGATGSFSRCSARRAVWLVQARPARAGVPWRVTVKRPFWGHRALRRGDQSGAAQQQLATDGRDHRDFGIRTDCAPAAEAWSLGRK